MYMSEEEEEEEEKERGEEAKVASASVAGGPAPAKAEESEQEEKKEAASEEGNNSREVQGQPEAGAAGPKAEDSEQEEEGEKKEAASEEGNNSREVQGQPEPGAAGPKAEDSEQEEEEEKKEAPGAPGEGRRKEAPAETGKKLRPEGSQEASLVFNLESLDAGLTGGSVSSFFRTGAASGVPSVEHELFDGMEALLSAVDELDFGGLKAGIDAALAAGGTQLIENVVRAIDIDGNTLLHRMGMADEDSSTGQSGDGERIAELLIAQNADVNAVNVVEESPLLCAVRTSAMHGVVRKLIEARADPDCADILMRETALMEVACSGDLELCTLLLDAGANPAQQNARGLTARDLAVEAGNDEVVLLPGLQASSQPEAAKAEGPRAGKSLRAAVRAADKEAVRVALEQLSTEELPTSLEAVDGSGRTVLHVCVSNAGNDDAAAIAQLLLQYSAKLDTKDAAGQVPLEIAVMAACQSEASCEFAVATVRELLSARAEPAAIDSWATYGGPLRRAAGTAAGEALRLLFHEFPHSAEWVSTWDTAGLTQKSSEADPDEEVEVTALAQAVPGGLSRLRERCEEHSIQLDVLGSANAADVLRECERWRGQKLDELRAECQAKNLQTERCFDRGELVSRLKQACIWRFMPMPELQAECASRAPQALESLQGAQEGVAPSRMDLEEALVVATWGGTTRSQRLWNQCEAAGIPVSRLKNLDKAAKLLKQFEHLQTMSLVEMRLDYRKRGFAPEAALDEQAMRQQLRNAMLWNELPVEDLLEACKERKVTPGPGEYRRGDLKRLLVASSWEAKGIPVRQLYDLRAAHELLAQVAHLETKSMQDLKGDCQRRGLPLEAGLEKQELVKRLRDSFVWENLPLSQLRKECRARGVPTEGLLDQRGKDEAALRKAAVKRLQQSLWVDIWESRGIPARRLRSLEAAANVFKQVEDLERGELSELKAQYKKLGLPPEAGVEKKELITRLRNVLIWEELPLSELKHECQDRKVETRDLDPRNDERTQHLEMVNRLIVVMCVRAWEAHGVPAARIGNLEAAARVVESLERFDRMTNKDIFQQYQRLQLPPEAGMERADVISRIKDVLIWLELPVQELRKEALKRKIEVTATDRRKMINQLITATWGGKRPAAKAEPKAAAAPEGSGAKPEQRRTPAPGAPPSKEPEKEQQQQQQQQASGKQTFHVPPAIQKHMSTLGLDRLDHNELRKAYRKLALIYHPDKNPGSQQEAAAIRFREVSEAYEAASEYLKTREKSKGRRPL